MTTPRERADRARVDVHRYRITLDLPDDGRDVRVRRPRSGSRAHARGRPSSTSTRRLRRATLDGRALDRRRVRRRPAAADRPGRRARARRAPPGCAYSHDGEGLHRFVDPADGAAYLCATSFLDNAPAVVRLLRPARSQGTLSTSRSRCPADWTVVGNGAATRLDAGHWQLATTAADLDLPRDAGRRPLARGTRRARRHPARPARPGLARGRARPRRAGICCR